MRRCWATKKRPDGASVSCLPGAHESVGSTRELQVVSPRGGFLDYFNRQRRGLEILVLGMNQPLRQASRLPRGFGAFGNVAVELVSRHHDLVPAQGSCSFADGKQLVSAAFCD